MKVIDNTLEKLLKLSKLSKTLYILIRKKTSYQYNNRPNFE